MTTTSPSAPPDDADRILLVDDDVTNLDVLRHTLDGRGYRLFVTRSGESAIDVARAAGAEVVGAAAIINRGGEVDLGVPFHALAAVSFPTWPADQIPEWLAAVPVTKPGSRPTAK